PERGSIPSFDDRFCSKRQLLSIAYIVEGRPRLLDHQGPEHAVKLMSVGKQMVMEKDGPQFFVREETFHQGFVFPCSRDILPAVRRAIVGEGIAFYQMHALPHKVRPSGPIRYHHVRWRGERR